MAELKEPEMQHPKYDNIFLTKLRHFIHQNPETGFKEFNT